MRSRFIIFVVVLVFSSPSSPGQGIRPFKDLVFSQVAAGGGYETLITVSNRGSEGYSGNLNFFRAKGEPWNPSVDGQAVAGGKVPFSLASGTTRTIRIAGDQTTQSGFAEFIAESSTQGGFLEGNLTYFVKTNGAVSDSVGVTPSGEFYLSTIPFEDFLTVALALVNRRPEASVQLSLFNQTNELVSSQSAKLARNEQSIGYLWQTFGRLTIGRGRLEIQSDVPITGTALTFVEGQFSSLPLLPAVRAYTMTTEVLGIACKGQLRLWADGTQFNGSFVITQISGFPTPVFEIPVFGVLQDSKLKLLFYAPQTLYGTPEAVGFAAGMSAFSFDQVSLEHSYVVGVMRGKSGEFGTGTFTLTRIP